ncbi:hypothetical protein TRFO_31670 [Tritrichomonas foetus]|uniref:Cytoplasmic tRNA 2-thiolation protein 2 n=1 Tax=Tritrichomonas foetus TaxID=1144522 RepID=A0A1J4JW20_9EUKA|nr:hypothetical protein TRFO_31670 [Tritrichomonas foetus]|eukprot:OHT01485.1 hypothetical protein TRFO_31670 [Tritrichomonas foetus]
MEELQTCCSCHTEKECFCLRKGVIRCADCVCDQVGRSTMDLFRKSLKNIPCPVHVLVAVSGGSSSMFAYDILKKRLTPNMKGKTTIVRKLEAVSSNPNLDIENLNIIPEFSIMAVIEYAKSHDFNCVVLADNVDRVSLGNVSVIGCGRPDLAHWISGDDFKNYPPITLLRPVRTCLASEVRFYCSHLSIKTDDSPSPFQKAFSHESKMLQGILDDGNGGIQFSVQKLGEKLPPFEQEGKCPNCGLPAPDNEICAFCATIKKFA